jgi:hypothetical protein
VAIGLYMIFGRFIVKAWRKRRTAYGLTDRRALVALGSGSLSESQLAHQPVDQRVSRRRRHMTVVFGRLAYGAMSGAMYANTGMEFFAMGQLRSASTTWRTSRGLRPPCEGCVADYPCPRDVVVLCGMGERAAGTSSRTCEGRHLWRATGPRFARNLQSGRQPGFTSSVAQWSVAGIEAAGTRGTHSPDALTCGNARVVAGSDCLSSAGRVDAVNAWGSGVLRDGH